MFSLYDEPRYFKFKEKYQQIRPEFSDYLSVSYDCGARNPDEYFNFDSITRPKVQNDENIDKN